MWYSSCGLTLFNISGDLELPVMQPSHTHLFSYSKSVCVCVRLSICLSVCLECMLAIGCSDGSLHLMSACPTVEVVVCPTQLTDSSAEADEIPIHHLVWCPGRGQDSSRLLFSKGTAVGVATIGCRSLEVLAFVVGGHNLPIAGACTHTHTCTHAHTHTHTHTHTHSHTRTHIHTHTHAHTHTHTHTHTKPLTHHTCMHFCL